jgi:hypothetical protein
VGARSDAAGDRRGAGRRIWFVALALALFLGAGVWATWPAVRHLDGDHYLARPAAGYGEAAAGDHLQLGWALWLAGHQLGRADSPLEDPYSFRPEAEAPPNLQGWLLGLPSWPLWALVGDVWAYDLLLLLTFVAAGGLTCWWLRALGLSRPAALVGGLVFALWPHRVGQSTGHLLGLIAFLLPALLLALERRRFVLAALALIALPLSGQLHLALGAIPLALGYGWARLPRGDLWRVAAGAGGAVVAGLVVQRWAVAGSIGTGRSFGQVERYSAELSDLVTRAVGSGVEELVFVGWLVPLLALAGLWSTRHQRGLALVLGLGALVPLLLALGAHLPGYERLWRVVPGLSSTRVPARLLELAGLALAGLVAFGFDALLATLARRTAPTGSAGHTIPTTPTASAGHTIPTTPTGSAGHTAATAPADPPGGGQGSGLVTPCYLPPCVVGVVAGVVTGVVLVLVAVDLRVPVFGAVAADTPSAAYAAIEGEGRLLELPVIRPDLHYGSVYLGYARQSPRERPQGYSTLAPLAADRWAREQRPLSCGRGVVPDEVEWVVVHRGVYAQSGFFGADCPARAEALLARSGWTRVARDGVLTTWRRRG